MSRLRNLAVLGTSLSLLGGCGSLIGLGDYEIDESLDEPSGGDGDGDMASGDGDTMTGDGDGDIGGSSSGGSSSGGSSSGGAPSGGSGSGGSPGECERGCDDDNECTTDSCVEGQCAYITLDAGEACSGGVCNGVTGAQACVRCVNDAPGEMTDSGCSDGAPRCNDEGTAVCTGCEAHADCDDDNECTTDACNAGVCEITTVAAGNACTDGVCNGVDGGETCHPCIDDTAGVGIDSGCDPGTPVCDTNGTNTCGECMDDASGTNEDTGCGAGTPVCDAGVCVECSSNDQCDDGVGCTDDVCNMGVCENSANDANCSDNGDVCSPNRCDLVNDCQQVDISSTMVLMNQSTLDGSFEIGGEEPSATWTEVGAYFLVSDCNGTTCTGSVTNVTPSSGNYLAWMGGVDGLDDRLEINVTLPAGTVELRLQADVNAQTTDGTAANNDSASAWLTGLGGTDLVQFWGITAEDAQTDSAVWTDDGIDATVDASTWANSIVRLTFKMVTDNPNAGNFNDDPMDVFFDDVRLTATVCQ